MEKKMYESPRATVTRVMMEKSIAQVQLSYSVYIEHDWEEGGVLGTDTPTEGGDIFLY